MPEYKRNHTIPKFMIKYWIDTNTKYKGVHVYDITSMRFMISTSLGKSAFSFAIGNDLYIHESYEKRAVGLEKWFSQQEDTLSILINQVHNKQPIDAFSDIEMTKILMAITGLEYRSNYTLKIILKAIENNCIERDKISANPERPSKQLLLENLLHLVTEQHLEFHPSEMIFMFAPDDCNFLLCDRPYFNHIDIEYRIVVLTNKIILGYRHSLEFMYKYIDVDKGFVEYINGMIAMNARDWLVASNEEELKKYSSVFHTKEWTESLNEDKAIFKPARFLNSGWTIDR